MAFIETEIKGPVATFWLNRPEIKNSLNETMIEDLTAAIQSFGKRNDIRVLIVRGRGDGFCAGADLNYMQKLGNQGFDKNVGDARKLATLYESMVSVALPVIAYVHNYAMGGANGIVAAADISIAVEECRFAFTETRLGIVPGVISPFVLRKAQHGAVRDWMLTGRTFYAHEAFSAGLIQYIEPASAPESILNSVVQHLLSASPAAVAACKNLIDDMLILLDEPEQAKRLSAEYIARARASTDGQEGLLSFLEKRKPAWFYHWNSNKENT